MRKAKKKQCSVYRSCWRDSTGCQVTYLYLIINKQQHWHYLFFCPHSLGKKKGFQCFPFYISGCTTVTATLSRCLFEYVLWHMGLDLPQMETKVSVSLSLHRAPFACSPNQNLGPSPTIMLLTWTRLKFVKVALQNNSWSDLFCCGSVLSFYLCSPFPTGLCFHKCGKEHRWVLHEWLQWNDICLVSSDVLSFTVLLLKYLQNF